MSIFVSAEVKENSACQPDGFVMLTIFDISNPESSICHNVDLFLTVKKI